VSALARFDAGGDGTESNVSTLILTALEKGRGAFQEDDVALLIAALRGRVHHAEIAVAACRAFSSVACDQQMEPRPQVQGALVQEGGLTLILEAMVVHAGDSNVQEHGCWTLCTLARKHQANAQLMVQGLDHAVPQAIKYAMDGNNHNVSLQEKACAALRSLCDGVEGNCDVLVEEGLVATLRDVMLAQEEAGAVQRQACGAFTVLASVAEGRGALVRHGCAALLREAARNHLDSTGVVEQVVGAMTNLAIDEQGQEAVAEAQCLDQTREIMFAHKYHPRLQESCCQFLEYMAALPKNQTLIVASGCMELILEAQRNFSSVSSLQEHAIRALAAIVNSHAENKMHAQKLDIFGSLRTVLQNHRNHGGVNESVLIFVLHFMLDKMLVRGSSFKSVVANEGFVTLVCDSMANCASAASVQGWACRVLHHLSNRSSEHKATIVAAGAIALVCGAMQRHATDVEILAQAVAVLLSLSVESAVQPVLVQNGCVGMIRNAMRQHAGHVKLQEDCIWTLLNIAWSDEKCQEAVRAAGVVPFILEARIRHKSSAVLEKKAKELLEKIDPDGALASGGNRVSR